MTLKELSIKVLAEYGQPMTSLEIWNYVLDKKCNSLVNVTGKTPWQTINAQIYVDMRDNENSKFVKVGKSKKIYNAAYDRVFALEDLIEEFSHKLSTSIPLSSINKTL